MQEQGYSAVFIEQVRGCRLYDDTWRKLNGVYSAN
jgi:hypothetical protein